MGLWESLKLRKDLLNLFKNIRVNYGFGPCGLVVFTDLVPKLHLLRIWTRPLSFYNKSVPLTNHRLFLSVWASHVRCTWGYFRPITFDPNLPPFYTPFCWVNKPSFHIKPCAFILHTDRSFISNGTITSKR